MDRGYPDICVCTDPSFRDTINDAANQRKEMAGMVFWCRLFVHHITLPDTRSNYVIVVQREH